MSKNKTNSNNNITTSIPKYYLHYDNRIEVSLERLRNLMSSLYEKARQDASKIKIYSYYNVFLSVGFTLALTLLTASFNDFFFLSGSTMRTVVIVLCLACIFIGILLAIINISQKNNSLIDERDTAVKDAMETIKQESNFVMKQ